MNADDYKWAIRLLRDIAKDAMDIVDAYGLDARVIAPILKKEEVLEEILIANFVEEKGND